MIRKHLNADTIYRIAKSIFANIPEHRANQKNIQIPLADALMSGLAIFSIKCPSLLQFDKNFRIDQNKLANIQALFCIKNVPSDTQIRTILDPLSITHIFLLAS